MDQIGRYSIVSELGKGAMGIVYEGEDPYIGRKAAIKTIRFDLISQSFEREEAIQRFIREAQSAGILNHPNIVTIYDVGEDAGLTYIAMQYIDGKSLEELIATGKRFSWDDIVNLMIQIGDAIDYAHGKGIIHRDIKPGNILIDSEGMAHLVDFGIARITTSTLTQTGISLGTPNYMSPEQIMGKKADHRADIFSVGAILFELLTNEKPFQGDNITTVTYKIMNEEPPLLATFDKNIPDGLDYVIRKALAKSASSRYQTCQELTEDLINYSGYSNEALPESAVVDEPITESVFYAEPRREKRKIPLLILLASMMVVVMAVVFAVYLFNRGSKQTVFSSSGGSVSQSSSPAVEGYFDAADKHLKSENYSEAIAEFKKILAVEPENFEALLGIANILKKQGKIENAIPEYEKLIGLNNSDPRPYEHLAEIFELNQDLDIAIEYYGQALLLAPEGSSNEKIIQKIQELDTLLQDPRYPEIKKSLDAAITAYQNKNYQDCLDQIEQVLILAPENAVAKTYMKLANLNIGIEAYIQGNYAECKKKMEQILKLEPENSSAQDYLTRAKNKLKDNEIIGILRRAQTSYQEGNFEESVRQSRKALNLDPKNEEAKKYLYLANQKIADNRIRILFNQYVQAVKNRTLADFYRRHCTSRLYQEKKEDAEMLFSFYDDVKIAVSNFSIQIKDTSRAEINFSRMITGIYRADGKKKVLSEGMVKWEINKQGDVWRIINIQ